MNAAGKSGLGFIFDERDNKNILLFITNKFLKMTVSSCYKYERTLSSDKRVKLDSRPKKAVSTL